MTFHKYGKIYTLGHDENKDIFADREDEIIIEEKIDGANFRFTSIDGRIIFGSRTNSLGDSNQEIGGNWGRCVRFIRQKIGDKRVPEGLIFYGECCVKHSLEYRWDDIPPYLGFDIMYEEKYIPYKEKKHIFEALDLPLVPLIKRIPAFEMQAASINDMVPQSAYANGPAEGIVFKNYNKQLFAKFVTEKFKEVNKDAFGASKKFASDDTERLVAAYCTNSRIDKHIFNLVQEGYKLEMALMQFLPKRVIEDIYAENWSDICNSKMKIDFQKVRSMINNRCKSVLQQVITNQALSQREENK